MTKPTGDALLDVSSALYETIDGSKSWSDAIGQLLRSTGSAHFTFMSFGRDGNVRQDSWPRVPECTIEYARDYADKDLRVARVLGGRRGVMTTRDLLAAEEIALCPVHQEHYRRFPDAWNSLFGTIEAEQRLMVPLLQRSAVNSEYTEEEKNRLRVLSPHIARVYHLKELLPSGESSWSGIADAIDGLEEGIIILDQDGIAEHMNASAQKLVDVGDGLVLKNGVLSATHELSQDALSTFMVETLRVLAGKSLHLPAPIAVRRRGKRFPLVFQSFVSPNGQGRISRAILKIRDGAAFRVPTTDMIRSAVDLTDAEARFAVALLRGETIAHYAEATGLSEHTVRAHMRNMREKLSVRRHSDVIVLLMRLTQT